MSPDMIATSKQLAALPDWKWTRRMVSVWHQPWNAKNDTLFHANATDGNPNGDPFFDPVSERWTLIGPDLTDAGMGGILLAMLPWTDGKGTIGVKVIWTDRHVSLGVPGVPGPFSGDTLAHAAGLALLAVRP